MENRKNKRERETGNSLSYPSCTVCSRTTKKKEKRKHSKICPPTKVVHKLKLKRGLQFSNSVPFTPAVHQGLLLTPQEGWISFSLNDFKSSVCRFLRIMCVFISLHSYCRAGLWSKFNDVLFFSVLFLLYSYLSIYFYCLYLHV